MSSLTHDPRYPPFESWPILSAGLHSKLAGRAIALFINNADCHLTTIDVFADGTIDC